MTRNMLIVAALSLAVAVPVLAQRGGGGNNNQNNSGQGSGGFGPGGAGGGFNQRGGRVRNQNNFVGIIAPTDYQSYTTTLDQTSIFARDRRAPSLTTQPVVDRTVAPVLVGITKDDVGYAAFLEEPRSGRISDPLHVGDVVQWDQSIVREVTLYKLTLSNPGNSAPIGPTSRMTRDIPLGYDLLERQVQNSPALPPPVSLDVGGGGNYLNNQRGRGAGGGAFGQGGGAFGIGGFNPGGFNGGGGGGGGRRGRGGGGGGGGGGGFNPGGGLGGGGFNLGGGFSPGGAPAIGITPADVTAAPAVDPSLPPGNADSLEQRMQQRRQQQINGGG